MTVKRKKRPSGRIYLEEWKSVRINGKVKSIFIRSIGPEDPIQRTVKPKKAILDRLDHGPSHRAGDVALLWRVADDLGFVRMIDSICCNEPVVNGISPGKLLTVWAINRILDPQSTTQLPFWVPTTDLPRLTGVNPADFTKDAFLQSLDFVCYDDRPSGQVVDFTSRIDDVLFRHWRKCNPLPKGESEVLAYDLTTVLFFGITCPLAEFGYNPEEINRRQVNVALLVTRNEKYPIAHFVYGGNRNGKSTIPNLIVRLQETGVTPGTLIWDRGNVTATSVQAVEKAGWQLICGLPKNIKVIRGLLEAHKIPIGFDTLVHKSDGQHIYAVSVRGNLFGKERVVTLYANHERGVRETTARHDALLDIDEQLKKLAQESWDGTEKELRKKAIEITGEYSQFVDIRITRKGPHPELTWMFKKRDIRLAEKYDGLFVLLATDEKLSAKEVVDTYLEKDCIEKVFRTMKSDGELEPVRHRLEHRVRGYMFVNVLAYRLQSALSHRLKFIDGLDDEWKHPDPLLRELGRVERTQTRLGRQTKTWYLNVSKKVERIIEKMGYGDLFKEISEVDYTV